MKNLCMDGRAGPSATSPATPFVGAEGREQAGAQAVIAAEFTAWDPVEGKAVWTIKEEPAAMEWRDGHCGRTRLLRGPWTGWFKAVDAKTGELKWQFKTGSGIIGQPVAYRGPDGHEYVANPVGG